MNIENPNELLQFAVNAVSQTKAVLLQNIGHGRQVDIDSGKDLKIKADKIADSFLIELLKGNSTIPILTEESGDLESCESKYRWIVDPLDGSFNFHREIPFNCISLALWKNEQPFLGVVGDINRDEIFSAHVELGAFLNERAITVSNVSKVGDAVLVTGFPVATEFSMGVVGEFVKQIVDYKKVRLLGSAALSLAYVASGRVEEYRENNIRIWDVAAGLALVKAAGGKIDFRFLADETTLEVIANNGKIN